MSCGDVDSCQDDPQYKVMEYLVFGTILSSLLSELQIIIPKTNRNGVWIGIWPQSSLVPLLSAGVPCCAIVDTAPLIARPPAAVAAIGPEGFCPGIPRLRRLARSPGRRSGPACHHEFPAAGGKRKMVFRGLPRACVCVCLLLRTDRTSGH